MKGFRWWRLDSLPEKVWPACVADIVRSDPDHPLVLADREESSVALSPTDWERVNAVLG